ncbi:MAG TPA: YfcE family phosphodiesterase [Candidatus Moranbacteria bacterium]|nr:YfcE family phosphodiesterase [Candidatus Moranbacteria bacterium]
MSKIAITSDIHNNEVNLKKVLDYCKVNNIQTIICCGDMASKEVLDFMNDNFSGNILYTFGNADYDDLRELEDEKKYRNTHLFKKFGEAIIEKKNVAFTHFPQEAKGLARTEKYNFVFYGHTHKPWEVMLGNCKLLNPGTTGGEIYPPTFAVWETDNDKFNLIRIHDLQ